MLLIFFKSILMAILILFFIQALYVLHLSRGLKRWSVTSGKVIKSKTRDTPYQVSFNAVDINYEFLEYDIFYEYRDESGSLHTSDKVTLVDYTFFPPFQFSKELENRVKHIVKTKCVTVHYNPKNNKSIILKPPLGKFYLANFYVAIIFIGFVVLS